MRRITLRLKMDFIFLGLFFLHCFQEITLPELSNCIQTSFTLLLNVVFFLTSFNSTGLQAVSNQGQNWDKKGCINKFHTSYLTDEKISSYGIQGNALKHFKSMSVNCFEILNECKHMKSYIIIFLIFSYSVVCLWDYNLVSSRK